MAWQSHNTSQQTLTRGDWQYLLPDVSATFIFVIVATIILISINESSLTLALQYFVHYKLGREYTNIESSILPFFLQVRSHGTSTVHIHLTPFDFFCWKTSWYCLGFRLCNSQATWWDLSHEWIFQMTRHHNFNPIQGTRDARGSIFFLWGGAG